MLVLSRKVGEQIVIGSGIVLVVKRIAGSRVTMGIEAPGNVRIIRAELGLVGSYTPETDREPGGAPTSGAGTKPR